MLTRREILRRGAGIGAVLSVGRLLGAYGSVFARVSQMTAGPTPLPAPETTTIRIACAPCDAPIMIAERYLRQEGFTTIEISDAATGPALASGKIDMGIMFPPTLANSIQQGQRVVTLGGLHPGCAEIWAQQGIDSLKDLRGRTIVVRSKALGDLGYSYTAIVLKQAGVNPSDVNFVVQSDADPVRLYLEGKNDAVFVATTGAAALAANPANKGRMIHRMVRDDPWAKLDCCLLVTTQDWYRAHQAAAKHAVRAIFRAADFQPDDRSDAVKVATDKGLFGGANNFDNVVTAANMVPGNWRDLDAEKSVRFFSALLADVGLLKIGVDEVVKAVDLRILRELRTELKRY
jgi:NitT/TauT family transport system substrate-binding protein